jgi:hypothetical protein
VFYDEMAVVLAGVVVVDSGLLMSRGRLEFVFDDCLGVQRPAFYIQVPKSTSSPSSGPLTYR